MNNRNERMMGAVSRLLAPALLLGLMLASPALGDIEREISVSPDGTLELELEAGATVEISGWGKDSIRVVGKVGRSSSAVDIEVVETRRGVRVSTEFRHHASHQNSSIDLIIQVPHHYNLDLDSMVPEKSIAQSCELVEASMWLFRFFIKPNNTRLQKFLEC